MVKLGSFELTSGTVMVSDPCYEIGTWCQAKLDNVKIGTWNGYVRQSDEGSWGIRNSKLIAIHDSIDNMAVLQWKEEKYDIGVDSGQAGIFDIGSYKGGDNNEGWYKQVSALTLYTEEEAGVTDGGVISRSGFGDGSYSLFTVRDDFNEIIAMEIVFI